MNKIFQPTIVNSFLLIIFNICFWYLEQLNMDLAFIVHHFRISCAFWQSCDLEIPNYIKWTNSKTWKIAVYRNCIFDFDLNCIVKFHRCWTPAMVWNKDIPEPKCPKLVNTKKVVGGDLDRSRAGSSRGKIFLAAWPPHPALPCLSQSFPFAYNMTGSESFFIYA